MEYNLYMQNPLTISFVGQVFIASCFRLFDSPNEFTICGPPTSFIRVETIQQLGSKEIVRGHELTWSLDDAGHTCLPPGAWSQGQVAKVHSTVWHPPQGDVLCGWIWTQDDLVGY
ncbi:hypothetical protein PILCRDRAFT_825306 [Piloderma croceum F 1598]|uniref:Uncharacterized protein n=1 Tax=Piloderma croceum (strain F 1598) TaxID=765440 RepID=A0A0C3AUB2_PILCF|nr:hypothetical protein PILCRDRAFT_825306 [Piloderma croceum F 1598]